VVFVGLALGLILLVGGGMLLVTGGSRLASWLGVSPVVIGLIVLGFGTSAPELVVNVSGAIRGESGLVFGNVIGSNIANLALILGVSAIVGKLEIRGSLVRREVTLLLLVSSIITVMALDSPLEGAVPAIGRSDAIILFVLFGIFIFMTARDAVAAAPSDPLVTEISENPMIETRPSALPAGLSVLGGLLLLFAGSELTIRSAVSLSDLLGVSPTLVGLFVVALGTSVPELVTSVIAIIYKESDLAVGNVVGSNLFNSLVVLPAGGLIDPIVIPNGGLSDLVFSWLLTAALIPIFIFGKARLGRGTGSLLLGAYIVYAGLRFTTGPA
jgi:cation:H+ antiporter